MSWYAILNGQNCHKKMFRNVLRRAGPRRGHAALFTAETFFRDPRMPFSAPVPAFTARLFMYIQTLYRIDPHDPFGKSTTIQSGEDINGTKTLQ
jgi:hypothetical protein